VIITSPLPAVTTVNGSAWRRARTLAAVAVTLTALVLFGPYLPWLTPAAGFVITVALPAFLFVAKLQLPGSSLAHRIILAVALAVFALILVGLTINTFLPLMGDVRPLARPPVAVACLIEDLGLIMWRMSKTPTWPIGLRRVPVRSRRVWVLLTLSLFSCVVGTNRLNNGASSSVTLFSFVVLLAALTLAWAWRGDFSDGETAAFFYVAALVLLLATSLRGWYITGHDIQREYHVFQVTNVADRWNISNFHDPYNACMSLTILPTMWARMLRIDDPYVFKIFFQAFFAMSAAALYLVCRRHFSRTSAFLAAIFYISFPTFLTDMPFITRQETGFTFLSVAALVIMSDTWAPATRRFWFITFGIAIVLSHYSTTYLLLIALTFSQVLWRGWQLWAHVWTRRGFRAKEAAVWGRPVAGLTTLSVIGLAAFLWTVPATHTSSQLRLTVTDTVETLLGRQQGATSTDISYSLFHSAVLSPRQELAQYRAETLKVTAGDTGDYLSRKVVDSYALPTVDQRNLPVTTAGRGLALFGISASTLNALMRSLLAKYYQVAAMTGLFLLVWGNRRRRGIPASQREYLCLAAASFVALAAVVLLPDLSVEYGLLRAFQQALIFLAPLVAETTLAIAWLVGGRRAGVAAVAVGIVALASLSGVIPQATGGYPPQLNLNNAGTYYNDYYLHPQELDAISWLDGEVRNGSTVQAEIETDRYTSYLVGDAKARTTADVFPTLIEKHAYVFLGYATVTLDKASVSIDGNTVTYRYPIGLLNSTKDLIFSSNGSRIYR
jgi:uncharacterized membrane protein